MASIHYLAQANPRQDGLARLKHPEARSKRLGKGSQWTSTLWDTPLPPDLDHECVLLPSYIPRIRSTRFGTVHLDSEGLTGLIFFCSHDQILAIHPHTTASPTVTPVFERLEHPSIARTAAWVYVPIAPGDRIVEFGIRWPPLGSHIHMGLPPVPCFMAKLP